MVVEFFYSVAKTEFSIIDKAAVTAARVSRQTRCYLYDEEEERWWVGRIGERDGNEYEVNLPDRSSVWVPEQAIWVRCGAPIDDPIDTLIARGHETAWYFEARRKLLRRFMQQRAAARGMTGLMSSRIDLYPHQVEVARRILADPVQRYLLADEVGLGKTIEAGIIIRQFLLDERRGHVLVLVPPLLVEQWRRELDARFAAFDADRVCLLSTADIAEIPEGTEWNLLVIDEAHHIASGAFDQDPSQRAVWEACGRLAREANGVLLLSATPAASHEAQFLAMLHLLEPSVYRLSDLEGFRHRVALRQEIGRVLLTITETTKPYPLKSALARLGALFPDDGHLEGLRNALQETLGATPVDEASRVAGVRALRAHVSETYRLHRRMLRNRRQGLVEAVLARRQHLRIDHWIEAKAWTAVQELVEEWRALVAYSVATGAREGGDNQDRRYRDLFQIVSAAALSAPVILLDAIAIRLGRLGAESGRTMGGTFPALRALATDSRAGGTHGGDPALHDGWDEASLGVLRDLPLLEDEKVLLDRLFEAANNPEASTAKLDALLGVLTNVLEGAGRDSPPKCLIFTDFAAVGHLLLSRLSRRFGRNSVAGCLAGMAPSVVEAAIGRFQESRDCFVLVCDRTGEEGRNLQFAEHTVLFDLPFSPNRLEQRLGRVDRIGRLRDLTFHVFLGPRSPQLLGAAWHRMLCEGFRIFDDSIAGLQFYSDQKTQVLLDVAFHEGAGGLNRLVEAMPEEIEQEKIRLEEQAAVDEIDSQDEDGRQVSSALDGVDMRERELQADVENWMCHVLGFERSVSTQDPAVVTFQAGKATMVPKDILENCFRTYLGRRSTFQRSVASKDPSIALLRLGESLSNSLQQYMHWDDRGRAFAFWREVAGGRPGLENEWIGFRFEFIVEADVRWAEEALEASTLGHTSRHALHRRADALFPAFCERVFVDVEMKEVDNPVLLHTLSAPFSKYSREGIRDYNLTKHRLRVLDGLIAPERWEGLCRGARQVAESILRRRASFVRHCQEAFISANRRRALVCEQLLLRSRNAAAGAAAREEATRDLELERLLGEALLKGLEAPLVRVDAVGMIVLSTTAPEAPLEGVGNDVGYNA